MNIDPSDLDYLDEERLLEMIGMELYRKERSALPIDTNELIARARNWIDQNWEAFREAICKTESIQELVANNSTKQLVLAIADLISGLITGVSPITVAILLTKTGIEEMCGEIWGSK